MKGLLPSCVVFLTISSACVKVPTIVVVDRKTALEEQIEQDFSRQEQELVDKGLSPRPTPYTRGELESKGLVAGTSELDVVLRSYKSYSTDQEQVDLLLKRRCIGEGRDALLVETRDSCVGQYDSAEAARLLQRVNAHRRDVIEALLRKSDGRSRDRVVRGYRAKLLELLVCGGRYQRDDGTWEVKSCD